jgi:hypothetical protein
VKPHDHHEEQKKMHLTEFFLGLVRHLGHFARLDGALVPDFCEYPVA